MLKRKNRVYWLQAGLFLLTLVTTTIAGSTHQSLYTTRYLKTANPTEFGYFLTGLYFSVPFLIILSVHEFGHYFAARFYKLKVTLPYYIPIWFPGINIGTMGAVIRLKSPTKTTRQFFDIGIAGPLAGWIAALILMFYGFTHLPPKESIFEIHPAYSQYGLDFEKHVYNYEVLSKYTGDKEGGKTLAMSDKEEKPEEIVVLAIGDNLLFTFFAEYVAPNKDDVPNNYELIHNPYLFAAYLALFFTSLNLLPIGQLDGGHILYGLVGPKWHARLSPVFFGIFVFYSGIGIVDITDPDTSNILSVILYAGFLIFTFRKVVPGIKNVVIVSLSIMLGQFAIQLMFPGITGFNGWLLFAFILGRFLGVYHPPSLVEQRLNPKRVALGLFSLVVFILSFSPKPFIVEVFTP